MGFIKGSVSLSRFWVGSSLPQDFMEVFPKKMSRYAFHNLDETSDEERSIGWVDIMDMFESRYMIRDGFKDPYLTLSVRIDVRHVPATALKQHCREAELEVRTREDLEFLSKKRREDIREAMKLKLIKRAIPRSNTYDMCWDLKTGAVIFGSTSNKICGEFTELFFKTFDLHLTPLFPYALAFRTLKKGGMNPEILDDLRSTSLVEERRA